MSCATPISWLRLERHHLGELAAEERAVVTEHLAGCADCAAAFARIVEDDARELPPLPKAATSEPRRARVRRLVPVATAVSALALAAAIVIAIGRLPRTPEEDDPTRMKGSSVSFTLVREDEMLVAEAKGTYRDGSRFKALVTCPPGMKASFDVAVYEAHGGVTFPLAQALDLSCGNSVPLPGAFRVTGRERMTVCLVWVSGEALDREVVRRTPPDLLPHALCKTLDPE